MRRFLGYVFGLALIACAGFVVYAYFVDLPSPTRAVETPAVGVGFPD